MPKRARTTRRLEAWLKDTGLPLFVLNAQRRLVFFNHGCEVLTGWVAADVLGQVCDYVTEAETQMPEALLAAIAPPPDVWTGRLRNVAANIPKRDGETVSRLIQFHPLTDDDQTVRAMLGVIMPAPEVSVSHREPVSRQLHAELASLRQFIRRRYGEGSFICRSASMLRVMEQLDLARHSSASVLFVGEPGVGKEHAARLLHYQGNHGKRAFVPIDCRRAATENLDAILERMSDDLQTDVLRAGAIYFDHIDSAPADFQRNLVTWIEANRTSNSIRILGGATQRLDRLVETECFSRELYFAISTLTIEIPSLRERPEDLGPLAQYFLEELNRNAPQQVGGFDEEVWRQFRRYNWLGNVAELRAVVEEARRDCGNPQVSVENLPFRFRAGVGAQSVGPSMKSRPERLDPLLERVEREQIELALAESRHNKARAAEILGINRARLYRRMEQLGIADEETGANRPDDVATEEA